MSKWARSSRLAFVLLGPFATQADVRGQPSRAADWEYSVPRRVEDAAQQGTLEEFANALAGAEIPIGVVIAGEDSRRARIWRPSDPQRSDQVVPLRDSIRKFEARNPGYSLRQSERAVRIQPTYEHKCVAALNRRLPDVSISGSAFEVVFALVKAVSDRSGASVPPGLVGSGLGGSSDADQNYRRQVSFEFSDVSLADALDDVVKAVPGLGWAVREVRDYQDDASRAQPAQTRCNLVLFTGTSWTATSWLIDSQKK